MTTDDTAYDDEAERLPGLHYSIYPDDDAYGIRTLGYQQWLEETGNGEHWTKKNERAVQLMLWIQTEGMKTGKHPLASD